ncbi:MAG TPA: glycosyltransferase family 4 protein [Caulobacteraceae bacterium]|jgi:glycosyltransferase involved in cell wall biosynthesis
MGKRRVAFLHTHPIQYFAPLYAFLNAAEDLSISAIYLSDYSIRGARDRAFGAEIKWDIDLLAGYDARFVAGAERRNEASGLFSMLAADVWREVRDGGFDALVVHGHTPAAMLLAAAAAMTAGVPVLARADTHLGLKRSPLKRALRKPLMRSLYGRCAGVLAVGTANRAFYRAMGVPEDRIFLTPYAVDNARFAPMSNVDRQAARARLGVADAAPIVLYSAKFSPRKRPADLIRAAVLLKRSGLSFHLAMVGSGELDNQLRALTAECGLENVRFPGFVNQSELPGLYAASDIFVLPSEDEPWGLAVNEAMSAGLPVVVASEVGCVADLVRDEINGRTFAAGNIDALAAGLHNLIADPAERARMGAASREIIAHWGFAECLTGLRQALERVAP